jgi:hypothetical protein
MRAANSAPIPHESESSCTMTTRFVFFTDSAIVSMSNGLMVRRSMTSVEMPDRSCTSLRRHQRALHQRAAGDDRHVRALADHLGLPERDHEVRAGIRALVVDLAVQVLVLEEEHGVLAADRGAQQARRVERGRRQHDAQPGQCAKIDSPVCEW